MTDKLAIVVSGKSATTMAGGLGAYAHNLCRIFSELGYSVYLLGYGRKADFVSLPHAKQITVKNPFASLSSLSAVITNKLLAREIARITKSDHAQEQIVVGAGIWSAAGIVARQSGQLPHASVLGAYFTTYLHEYEGQARGCPAADYGWLNWVAVRAALVGAWLLAKYEHNTIRRLDRIVTHYESSEQILQNEVIGLDPDRFYRTAYYVDLFERHSPASDIWPDRNPEQPAHTNPSAALSVGVLCRQDPRKGINIFLHAVKHLRNSTNQPFICSVAGNGVFLDRNRALSRKLSISDLVEFKGFISSSEEFIKQADIIVLPSFEEGAGAISILEAMKLGKPIVSSSCDGIPEDLTHESNALLFTPGNFVGLSAQLKRVIESKQLRADLGRNAQITYEQKFSFDQMKTGFSELLANLREHATS